MTLFRFDEKVGWREIEKYSFVGLQLLGCHAVVLEREREGMDEKMNG